MVKKYLFFEKCYTPDKIEDYFHKLQITLHYNECQDVFIALFSHSWNHASFDDFCSVFVVIKVFLKARSANFHVHKENVFLCIGHAIVFISSSLVSCRLKIILFMIKNIIKSVIEINIVIITIRI